MSKNEEKDKLNVIQCFLQNYAQILVYRGKKEMKKRHKVKKECLVIISKGCKKAKKGGALSYESLYPNRKRKSKKS